MSTEGRTRWTVRVTPAYDALCLLNIFTGDAFYTAVHPGLRERWWTPLPETAQAAFERLSQVLRVEQQGIISARLCLTFSAFQPVTLDDLLRAIQEPEVLRAALEHSPYFDLKEWHGIERILPDLGVVLRGLADLGFEASYAAEVVPELQQAAAAVSVVLTPLDIVWAVETELGRLLDESRVEVHVLAFTAPHGMKLVGQRLIVAATWTPTTAAFVAAHELMHPPYDLLEPGVAQAVEALHGDGFLREHFERHDPRYGYNTWAGYVEENCVRALDQVVAERLGVAQPAWPRWTEGDGGMHVLAAVLHPLIRDRPDRQEPFGRWFARMVKVGALRPGTLETRYRELDRQHRC